MFATSQRWPCKDTGFKRLEAPAVRTSALQTFLNADADQGLEPGTELSTKLTWILDNRLAHSGRMQTRRGNRHWSSEVQAVELQHTPHRRYKTIRQRLVVSGASELEPFIIPRYSVSHSNIKAESCLPNVHPAPLGDCRRW